MSAFTSVVSNKANLTCTTGVEDEKPIVLFHNQLHPMKTNSGPYLQFARKVTVESNDAEKPTNQDPLTNLENEDLQSALVEALGIEQEEFDGHLTTLKEAIDAANATLDAAKEANESKKVVENAKKAANEAKYDAFVVFFRAIIDDDEKLTKFLAMTKDDLNDSAKCTVYYSWFKIIFASIVADYKAAPVVDGKKEVTPFTYGSVVAAITAADLPLKSKKATKSDEDEEGDEDEKDEDEDSKKQKHHKPTLFARVLKWIITLDIIENRITPAHIKDLRDQKNGKGKWPAYNITHIRSIYGLVPITKNLPQPPKSKPLGVTLKQSEIKALEEKAEKAKEAQKKAQAAKKVAAAKKAADTAKQAPGGKGKGGKARGPRGSKNKAAPEEGEKKKNNKRKNTRKPKKAKKDPEAEEEKKEEEKADEPAPEDAPAEEAEDAAEEETPADAQENEDDDDSDEEEE